MDTPSPLTILGTPVHPITQTELETLLKKALDSDTQTVISTPNPEIVLKAWRNPQYRAVLQRSNLNIPDGAGLQWASAYNQWMSRNWIKRLLAYAWLDISALRFIFSKPFRTRAIPERITGTDTVKTLGTLGSSLFLLGSFVTESATSALEKDGAIVVGTSELNPQEHDHAIQAINDSGAQILLVAYGAPTQEQWIDQHKNRLPHVRVFMGVGGAFDMISGVSKRAPSRMRSRFEWLWRLLTQPKRIVRIFNAIIRFPLTVSWNALKKPNKL